jgi:regulator of cell morphogenesis and NO signaling
MMTEHDDHTENLRRTRELTRDFALPSDASVRWRALYQELQRLEDELGKHIELENKVLFPRALAGER